MRRGCKWRTSGGTEAPVEAPTAPGGSPPTPPTVAQPSPTSSVSITATLDMTSVLWAMATVFLG